jgi:type IV secretion system protein VirB5
MLSSLKQLTDVNSLATSLISSAERNILPSSTMNAATLLSGNVASLGSLGPQVQQFQSRFALTVNNPADQAYATALQNATGLAATNAALGSSTLTIAQQRTEGLEQLRTALDSAQDPKQVMDLSARIAVEQAHLQNDELKLKSIEMTEQGQAALGLAQANATRARDQNALYAANIVSGQ